MRWLDGVHQYSERTGETKRRRQARNRDKWKKLMNARAQPGNRADDDDDDNDDDDDDDFD